MWGVDIETWTVVGVIVGGIAAIAAIIAVIVSWSARNATARMEALEDERRAEELEQTYPGSSRCFAITSPVSHL